MVFSMFRKRRQNQTLLAAAIRAERWFTHQECIGADLDYEAFQAADAIRAAVHPIQEDDPVRVELAEAEVEKTPYPYGEA